jgi:hypothetical protein
VAEDGGVTADEDSGHPDPVLAESPMADGVDAAMSYLASSSTTD